MSDNFIPLSVPNLKGNELKYITEAVETEWVSSSGSFVNSFEEQLASYVGVDRAVSCQNGTSGLHLALLCAGVSADDAVIVPTLTFIAAVNPVSYVGAAPIFMDCDDSLGMDPHKLRFFLKNECMQQDGRLIEAKSGRQIKAVLVVHVFGNMADMESLLAICEEYDLILIEDATEALGTKYTSGSLAGRYAGTIGDIGVYSFNGNKIITTGGGGMIVSRHPEYLDHARHLSTQAKSDELNYIHDEIGYNYRMTNLQAALGLAQLEQMEQFITIKEQNYERYLRAFEVVNSLHLLSFRGGTRSNKWFYALDCRDFTLDRDELIQHLLNNGIQSRPIWGLISDQKPYLDARSYQIEKANEYWQHVVNIPCSTNLSEEDVDRVIGIILSVSK